MDLLLTNGDLTIVDGDLVLTSNTLEDVGQEVAVLLETHLGEYELDVTSGVPYREQVLGKNRDEGQLALLFKRIVEQVPRIVRVEQSTATINRRTRALTVCVVGLVSVDGQQQALEITASVDNSGVVATFGPLGGF